jgi:hypothetical protein
VYQFTASVRPELERLFGRVERRFELLNVLPAHLFFCERSAAWRAGRRPAAGAGRASSVLDDSDRHRIP